MSDWKYEEVGVVIDEDNRSEIDKLKELLNSRKSSLTNYYNKELVEKWFELKLKDTISKHLADEGITSFKVFLENRDLHPNYFAGHFSIHLYRSKENEFRLSYTNTIQFTLGELFSNCSSICLSKLISDSIYNSTRYELVSDIINIIIEFCGEILEYSILMYTSSVEETNKNVNKYLEGNFEMIKQFKNKRNKNNIKYYIKEL